MAGRYNLEELKNRADLAAEVAARSGPGRHRGKVVTFPCPNPDHTDNTPSFTVNTTTGRYKCWSQCDRAGDVIDLFVWLDGYTAGEAIEHLARRYGLHPDTSGQTYRPTPKAPTPPAVKLVTPVSDTAQHLEGDTAADVLGRFLTEREWSPEVAELVGLEVVTDTTGRPRVRFPFLLDGAPVVWQDRATTSSQKPKWLTPAGATLYPFGIDCLDRYDGPADTWPACPVLDIPAVWIVEGPADAVTMLNTWPAMSVLGLPGSSWWNARHVRALDWLPAVIVTDNDPAGETLRAGIAADLEPGSFLSLYVPEPHNDLADWYRASPATFAAELVAAYGLALDRLPTEADEVVPV